MDKYKFITDIMKFTDEMIMKDVSIDNKGIIDEYSYEQGRQDTIYEFSKKIGELIRKDFK